MNRNDAIAELARAALAVPGLARVAQAVLDELEQAATVLVFRHAGLDAAGRTMFEVGNPARPGDLIPFSARNKGVGYWHKAVRAQPRGELVRFGNEGLTRNKGVKGVVPTGLSSENTRMMMTRGLEELREHCAELADVLEVGSYVSRGAVTFQHVRGQPRIVTE